MQRFESDGDRMASGFSNREIRMGFIRKVYSILATQLTVTTAFIAMFLYARDADIWFLQSSGLTLAAFATYFIVNLVLMFSEKARRHHPTNMILLGLFTLALSYIVGVISSSYNTHSVILAFGVCAFCCSAVMLFSLNTKHDFTSFVGVLFSAAVAFTIFGIMMMFLNHIDFMHKFYAGCGGLLFMAFLAFDTQLIMGGKKFEISPEDYVFATIQLYMDIIQIFLYILENIGDKKKGRNSSRNE